ncbi:MAG TPA: hypothetical protein VNN13_07380 [Methylomirabilota bacterium]|nr:hypothetical protein [Methylomirabilota bacterium]
MKQVRAAAEEWRNWMRNALLPDPNETKLLPPLAGFTPEFIIQRLFQFTCWINEDQIVAALNRDLPELTKGAIDTKTRSEKLVALREKKRALEEQIEARCRALEQIGHDPARRPDADPAIVLQFKSKETWDRSVLERIRERSLSDHTVASAVQRRFNEVRQDRVAREWRLQERLSETERRKLEAEIAEMKAKEKEISERLAKLKDKLNRDGQLLNRCLEFLRSKGVPVSDLLAA